VTEQAQGGPEQQGGRVTGQPPRQHEHRMPVAAGSGGEQRPDGGQGGEVQRRSWRFGEERHLRGDARSRHADSIPVVTPAVRYDINDSVPRRLLYDMQ
jgi:hypothetical protein